LKKRIQKKLKKGKFTEYAIHLRATLKQPDESFIDSFIDKIESLKCFCGGSLKPTELDMIVELGKTEIKEKRALLVLWLGSLPNIKEVFCSDVFDVNHDKNYF